jgi:hypothetical protein
VTEDSTEDWIEVLTESEDCGEVLRERGALIVCLIEIGQLTVRTGTEVLTEGWVEVQKDLIEV